MCIEEKCHVITTVKVVSFKKILSILSVLGINWLNSLKGIMTYLQPFMLCGKSTENYQIKLIGDRALFLMKNSV